MVCCSNRCAVVRNDVELAWHASPGIAPPPALRVDRQLVSSCLEQSSSEIIPIFGFMRRENMPCSGYELHDSYQIRLSAQAVTNLLLASSVWSPFQFNRLLQMHMAPEVCLLVALVDELLACIGEKLMSANIQ